MIAVYVLLAVVILLFMVLIHEFGHYIVGKILKFKITEFSVGFGPALFSRKSKKTGEKFSFRIFPLGGYCAFYGEDEDGNENSPDAFNNQKPWKRILVFLAGVTANFITAIIFSWILLCTMGYDVKQVASVQKEFPNAYQVGDVITHINGQKIDFAFGENYQVLVEDVKAEALQFYKDKGITEGNFNADNAENVYTFKMTVKRDGKIENLDIIVYPTTETVKEDGKDVSKASVMVGLSVKAYKYNAWQGFCRSFEVAFGFAWAVLKSLWMLITFQIPIKEMGGTIATISTIATVAQQSLSYLLVFIPLIAANLAVFNILPFPALDGAHVLFTLIEWIRGKPINRKVESMIHFVGLCILFGFVIIVDILHFVL